MAAGRLPKRVHFEVKTRDDFKRVFVNGAYGGISPRGEFKIDFVFDYYPNPTEEVWDVSADGTLVPPKTTPQPEVQTVVRELVVGVLMTADQALSLAEWIVQQVRAFKGLAKVEEKK